MSAIYKSTLPTLVHNDKTPPVCDANGRLRVIVDAGASGASSAFLTIADLRSGTATRTSVNSSTSSATILAANANRKGASIYNSDANPLYLDLSGGTAAATRCQYAITTGLTFEVPFGFTGAITGIWGSDGSGAADVVEFT